MKFIVEKEIFEKLPNACFGVVMAKGIDNNKTYPEIEQLLDESIAAAAQRFEGKKVKEEPDILPYREAFRALASIRTSIFALSKPCLPVLRKEKGCRISTRLWTWGMRFP